MARITSQEAAEKFGGLFEMVLGAAQRAKEIHAGSRPRVESKNGPLITAIKEIEEGKYTKKEWLASIPKKQKRTQK